MEKILFSDISNPKIALLIKDTSCKKGGLSEYYAYPLNEAGIALESIAAYSLEYPSAKVTVKQARSYLDALLPELEADGIELIYAADAEYFRQLVGKIGNADAHIGYVYPCAVAGYEHMNVVLGASFASIFHNPATQTKINQTLDALIAFNDGKYLPPGSSLFDNVILLDDLNHIKQLLQELLKLSQVTCDIETLSLHFRDAGISTIAFSKDQHSAWAFPVNTHGGFGEATRELLKEFFTTYTSTHIWHNAGYDLKVIVYTLWMKHPLDFEGMYEGIGIMTRNFHCTRLIAYLALNSCARVQYSLKVLAQEFAGNYAEQNIDNVLLIEPQQLLKYNCVDTMATWYVFNKYYQKMIDDNQNELYEGLFKDSVALLIQIELTGMPINMEKVLYAEAELLRIQQEHTVNLFSSKIIQDFNLKLQQTAYEVKQASLKKKIVTLADFSTVVFNPASGPQCQELIYDVLGLPVIDKTKKKQPATGNKTLSKLKKHTTDSDVIEVLNALIELGKVTKILSAFIPAFKDAWLKADGCHYLHGNFNLGGTVSGRLSSNNPNLQNLPAGSTYGKLIKDCFSAPKGWIMFGADFASLEDRISALTTKDPNKLKVYEDGFDGHSLRAYTYYKEQMPSIVDTVASINTIADLFDALRSRSKAPTFALTYQGTHITLMKNCGFTEQEAKLIETRYHELYQVSDKWIQDKLRQASIDGYVTAAFGLRVRTPLLKQIVFGSKSIPFEAAAEGRTAGNALGQSYGLLNNRAAVDFNKRILNSTMRGKILPTSLIHDAIYGMVKDDIDNVFWLNENLPDCMAWQELPEIQHPTVKLSGEVDLHYPSWKYKYTLPNGSTKKQIRSITSIPHKK